MQMEEETISQDSVAKLSQVLVAVMILMTAKFSYDFYVSGGIMRELFVGMNLTLPAATQFLLMPVSNFAPFAVLALVLVKGHQFRSRPLLALKWHIGGLVGLVVLRELLIVGLMAPIVALVGNLS